MPTSDDFSFLAPPGEVADWRLVVAFDAAAEVGLFEELPATPTKAAARLGLDERALFGASAEGDFTGEMPRLHPLLLLPSALSFAGSLLLSVYFKRRTRDNATPSGRK